MSKVNLNEISSLIAKWLQNSSIDLPQLIDDKLVEKAISIPQFGITECLIQYKCSVNTPPPHAIRSG